MMPRRDTQDGTYSDEGYCYFKKKNAANCDYYMTGCMDFGAGNPNSSQCTYYKSLARSRPCALPPPEAPSPSLSFLAPHAHTGPARTHYP